MTTRRWPVHPAPIRGEAASSWLTRLTVDLHTDLDSLFADLGRRLDGPDDLDNLDVSVPARFAQRLAARTGLPVRQVRQTGLVGYHPSLIGTLRAHDQFAAYTKQFSVLLRPGQRSDRHLHGWLAWLPTDLILMWQACPSCLPTDTDPPPYAYPLAWAIPIMLTCPIHHRWLAPSGDRPSDYVHLPYPEPEPASPAVETMDARTWQALLTGRVTLPGGNVPARIWFRLLRTVIDELTDLPPELARIAWQQDRGSGHPADTEQPGWQPYETLPPDAQDETLEAAATVMAALRDGTVTARGDAAHLLLPRTTSRRHRVQPTTDTCAAHF